MHCFQYISKNVFIIQQIFTCKQYGAHRPDSQQPNLSDDLSIDKHWPWYGIALWAVSGLWVWNRIWCIMALKY